ncbi:GTP cyclohydrolase I, partial [Francisella tularensis subsp. holarctica]|uniref:GTP cyclohydrolase I n=1 Tax=Francisella tularensis TaxID=263 RepID=UPI002381B1C3
TAQIIDAVKFMLSTEDVSVKIKAKHACVSLRGVYNQNSQTYTQMVGGVFDK